jgi:bacillithiol system protein YtxJ
MKMNWINLTDLTQLDLIRENSKNSPIMIFKYSRTCSTSSMVINRLERNWQQEEMSHVQTYFLDLLSYRQISNAISEQFKIRHESPQVLIIKDGEAIYNGSHFEIDYAAVHKATKD